MLSLPCANTFCFFAAPCLAKVKITAIKVPLFVENGTQPSVVLDCPFTYDKDQDIHLVVKWFFNDDPEPIYQWITEFGTRNVHQRYEGKINANYTVPTTNDPLQKHRALNLIRPTVELNGRYSCHVISIMSQDAAEATMIIYGKCFMLFCIKILKNKKMQFLLYNCLS